MSPYRTVEILTRIECAECGHALPDVIAETAHFSASPACASRAEVLHTYDKARVFEPPRSVAGLPLFEGIA